MKKLDLFLVRLFNGHYNYHIFIIAMIILLLLCSCGSKKVMVDTAKDSIRVEYREKVIMKDSLVEVPIPFERIITVAPMLDTLTMENSTALSTAYLDTLSQSLKGSLISKEGGLKTNVNIPTKIITNDSIVYKDRFITKTEYVPYIPKWYSWLCASAIILALFGGLFLGMRK